MGKSDHIILIRSCLIATTALLCQASAYAGLPGGGNVVAGAVSIASPDAYHQLITQTSTRAIIDWQNFSIGASDVVRIVQPGSASVMLNRVVGADPSSIFGSLSANGQVFLVNPNGVYFAPGSSVDVAGLVAGTLNIRNQDFMDGNFIFAQNATRTARAEVLNAGVIKAREGGYVVLAGDYAANSGIIQARLGTVALASGSKMTLDISGDNLVNFTVDSATLSEMAGVANSGQLLADGGRAIMTASVANTLATTVVNNTGLVQARAVMEKGGEIYLLAGDNGANVAGTLDAGGGQSGQQGGSVSVLGAHVALVDAANVEVSGAAGGGTVLIGGNFQGTGPQPDAKSVDIGKDAVIRADALDKIGRAHV